MSTQLTLWRNARFATLADQSLRSVSALVTRGDRIAWAGAEEEIPAALHRDIIAMQDLAGAWVTPGLIDCHTHLVFAGTRASEYAERLRGVSYEEIARRGGGILTTVRATRAAGEQQLLDESAPRLESLLAEGVTTVEVKSGYGLTLADEAKMLRVARRLGRDFPARIRTTLLAAHALPPEYAGRPDEYIDTIAERWLPELQAQGLVDAVDVFCDRIGFTAAQSERLFRAARELGIPVKMHAEQLANIGGTQLAARYGALSCDHLECSSAADAAAMAASGTVAVLLPVAFYCLAETRAPPVAELRAAGTSMAVATDCNPGSAPSASLLLALNMSTRLFGLTAEEALAGVTRHAARALGLQAEVGTLAPGQLADFAIWDVQAIEELAYWVGLNRCRAVVEGGRLVRGRL
jgi:imidazolonepropionase